MKQAYSVLSPYVYFKRKYKNRAAIEAQHD